jgi:hypothetical protein
LLVLPGFRAPGSLVAIVSIGVLHATYFYPHAMAVRSIVAALCDAGLIGFVIVQVRRKTRRNPEARGSTDPVDAIRTALASVFTPSLVKLITAELSILYYGLFSWRAKPHIASEARAFTIHERVGNADIFGVLPLLCLLEIPAVHLLLQHWSPALAWIATGVSLYGVIWLIGLARAFRLRPVLVGRDYLYLRYGLLFQLRVPKEMIAHVRRAEAGDKVCAVPRRSEPTICIELVQVMDGEGPFGIRKWVNRVAVTPDDEPGFERALAELMSDGDSIVTFRQWSPSIST